MITTESVYTTLLNLIREDKRGLALSPDEYNRISRIVNERIYTKKYNEFETTTDNIDTLAGFKELDVPLVLAAGTTSLPSDYRDMIGKPRIVNNSGATRRCDLVSQIEADERAEDFLTQPTETYPIYTLGELDGADNIILHLYPTTITGNITIDYLRDAAIPFLDYVINATTLVPDFWDAGIGATLIPTGSTYRDGTPGDGVTTKVSQTVDWEFSDSDMQLILSIFMGLLGITLPDTFLTQVGNAEEIKNQ